MNTENRRQDGVVLLLAVVVMIGIVLITVGAMEVTLTHANYGQSRLERLQSMALTEGGADRGYQKLEDDPSFRGTFRFSASTGDECAVTITDVAGGVKITSVADIGEVTRGVTAHLSTVSEGVASFTHPAAVNGRPWMEGTTFEIIGGPLTYGTPPQLKFGGAIVGDTRQEAFGEIVIDPAPLTAIATQVLPDSTTLGPGVLDLGTTVIQGDATLVGPLTATGVLLVLGNLEIDGSGGDVVLGEAGDPLTLVVDGQVWIIKVATLSMHGLFANTNWFEVTGPGVLNGSGGLYTSMHLGLYDLDQAIFTFDESVLEVPPGVTGLPATTTGGEYSETWRQRH